MTVGPSKAWDTIVYSGEACHQVTSRRVHILGFQNRVVNEFDRPNAIVLPVPSALPLGPANLVDVPADALLNPAGVVRRMDPNLGLRLPRVEKASRVLQRGRYGVVFVNDPQELVPAVEKLPEADRPPCDRRTLAAFVRWYPQWPLLLLCWRGRMHAEPVVLWYEPVEAKKLFLPTLDASKGGVPEPLAVVQRDLTLLVGSTLQPFGVSLRGPSSPPLAPSVWGTVLHGSHVNVDYEVEVAAFRGLRNRAGRHDLHERLDPKIWSLEFRERNPSRA